MTCLAPRQPSRAFDRFASFWAIGCAIHCLAHIDFTKVESTGHEETFQVNYLSTFLLAVLLLPTLKAWTESYEVRSIGQTSIFAFG